jgi:hypothetical protein
MINRRVSAIAASAVIVVGATGSWLGFGHDWWDRHQLRAHLAAAPVPDSWVATATLQGRGDAPEGDDHSPWLVRQYRSFESRATVDAEVGTFLSRWHCSVAHTDSLASEDSTQTYCGGDAVTVSVAVDYVGTTTDGHLTTTTAAPAGVALTVWIGHSGL